MGINSVANEERHWDRTGGWPLLLIVLLKPQSLGDSRSVCVDVKNSKQSHLSQLLKHIHKPSLLISDTMPYVTPQKPWDRLYLVVSSGTAAFLFRDAASK